MKQIIRQRCERVRGLVGVEGHDTMLFQTETFPVVVAKLDAVSTGRNNRFEPLSRLVAMVREAKAVRRGAI